MKASARFVLGVFLALSAPCVAWAQTQFDLNQEACAEYKQAQEEMEKAYRQAVREREDDVAFVVAFQAAQTAWTAYRDSEMLAMFPNPEPRAYGSVLPMCSCYHAARLTIRRTAWINENWNNIKNDDLDGLVCGGSQYKSKPDASPEKN